MHVAETADMAAALLVQTARAVAAAGDAREALSAVLSALRQSVDAPRAAVMRADGSHLESVLAEGFEPSARSMHEATVVGEGEGAYPLIFGGRLEGLILLGGVSRDELEQQEARLLPILDLAAVALRNLRLSIEHDRAEALELERARLDGVLLAARTAQHRMNNDLSVTVGMLDLILVDPRLPSDLKVMIDDALQGVQSAADTLHLLQRLTRLESVDVGGPGNVLVIDGSAYNGGSH